jgi:hypothetical protein
LNFGIKRSVICESVRVTKTPKPDPIERTIDDHREAPRSLRLRLPLSYTTTGDVILKTNA